MSDETARQIKYLIEITQQDIPLKASLLADVVEGEILVSEMLQDIKLDVADIKDGLFQFFNDEQIRFKTQQDQADEEYFRTLESLREAKRDKPTPQTPQDQTEQQSTPAGSGGLGGLGNLGLGLLGAGALGRFLVGRFLPAAAIAGVVTGVIDYMAERPRILERLSAEGLTGEDLETEATTQALGEVMSDFSDNVVEPLVKPIAALAAKEFGFNNEEIIELRKSVDELSGVFERGTVGLIDMFGRILGRESASAAQRDDQKQINELQQEINEYQQEADSVGLMTPEGQLTDEAAQGLSRLEEISARKEEMRSLPEATTSEESRERAGEVGRLREEERQLRVKLSPVLRQQELVQQRRELQRIAKLSQAGYAAGELQTDTQLEFQQTPSDKKEEYYKNKISPEIKSAIDSGALSRSYYNTVFNAIQDYGIPFGPDSIAIPVVIEDFKKIEDLSPDQIEAILTNDDILLNSIIMRGALETSDREAVEQIYRIKTEGAADPRTQLTTNEVPQLDLGGTIEPGQAAIVGEKGPELVLGPAEVVGREDTSRIFDLLEPSPAVSAIVPVGDMSRNVAATSSAPIVVSTSQGGSQITNMVNNNSQTVLGGGAPARSSDISSQRLFDRMQYT